MREFGSDFWWPLFGRRRRLSWRRGVRMPRLRLRPAGVGAEERQRGPGVAPRPPVVAGPMRAVSPVEAAIRGPGCPAVLTRMGYVGLSGLDVTQMRAQGFLFPAPGGVAFSVDRTGSIWQIRSPRAGAYEARTCRGTLSPADAADVVRRLNAMSSEELRSLGYL